MSEIKTIETKPAKVKIDPETKVQLASLPEEQSQVIIHGDFVGRDSFDMIRIWKTTYLYPKGFDSRCQLVSANNISWYPEWTWVPTGQKLTFSLIFTGLPKGCTSFDVVEDIPESGGFIRRGIIRNQSDVYYLIFE